MDPKPELIIFSHKITTGIYSFYRNLLQSDARDQFDTTVIFHDNDTWTDSKAPITYQLTKEIIYEYKQSLQPTAYEIAADINRFISNKKGTIVTNFITEMVALHIHPKPGKTIFFICHDDNHYRVAKDFNFMIDVFIAHNQVYVDMYVKDFPDRASAAFYLPYGISMTDDRRRPNPDRTLNIVWLARLMPHKGIHHIPVIDRMLKDRNVLVNWTIIGDGPEKTSFQQAISSCNNFSFHTPADYKGVIDLLKHQDIFILPSSLDGLPVSMIEAMSVGCVPVISAFNEGIRRIITKDVGIVLPVNDNMAFVDAIIALHQNRPMLEELSTAAYSKAHADYDLEKQSAKYFELFAKFNEFNKLKKYPHPGYKGKFLGKLISPKWRSKIKKLVKK